MNMSLLEAQMIRYRYRMTRSLFRQNTKVEETRAAGFETNRFDWVLVGYITLMKVIFDPQRSKRGVISLTVCLSVTLRLRNGWAESILFFFVSNLT